MRAEIKYYWIKAALVSLAAFALGVVAYVLVGIAIAHGESKANAAYHQVTVSPIDCICIVKFIPERPSRGDGSETDPIVTYVSRVPLVVGVTGAGLVTIEDEHGRVLYSYYKTEAPHSETIAQVDLPDGLGLYALVVKLDGVVAIEGPNVMIPMFIDYRAVDPIPLPPVPPLPPATGASYLYVGGYAVQTIGVLLAGLLFGAITFGVFVLVAMGKRRQDAQYARDNIADGRVIKRELSAKAIDKVVTKKTRRGRRRSRFSRD